MLKIQNNKVSKDLEKERQEHDVLLGEKNNLQNEMISLGSVIKKLKKEINSLEENKEVLSLQVNVLKEYIDGNNKLKLDQEQLIKDLDKEYLDKKNILESSLPDVKKILLDLEAKKAPIQLEIEKLSSEKIDLEKSLQEGKKLAEEAKKSLNELSLSLSDKGVQEAALIDSIEKKKIELQKLDELVYKNKVVVEGIEKRQIVLSGINKDIADAELKFISVKNETKKILEDENESLKKEILKNKEINEQEKSLHISLLTKQDSLNNRESFLRNQYLRAGLKWE